MVKRIFYPLFLLLIPLFGMFLYAEVNWGLFDFIIMGLLLILVGVGINFIENRTQNLKKRILFIGILILIFMVIWVELAVGVFGLPFAGN
ncbi:MAG: hypothetical protein P8O72_02605 [Flavobacteriaceae bacterium]|nr:hypothetical protein [Flavobacteriaceae bacterium]